MAERAQDRLSRLLGLVPYLTRRPGTALAEVAAHFEVTEEQIVDDLELLFVTGRPGHMPDDLIEAEWGSGAVFVGNADEVSVPVRLSAHEAGGLLLALDHLGSAHEADPKTLAAVRAKLATAAGDTVGTTVDAAPPRMPTELATTIRTAIRTGGTLDLTYYVPARDELTRRMILPHRLRLGRVWYLDAHCLTAGGDRSFVVEHIRSAEAAVSTAPIASPAGAGEAAPAGGDRPAAEARTAGGDRPAPAGAGDRGLGLVLAPAGAWLADELAPEQHGGTRTDDTHGPGSVSVTLPHAGTAWAVRLLSAHGAHVLTAAPQSLVDAALADTRAALSLYDGTHGSRD